MLTPKIFFMKTVIRSTFWIGCCSLLLCFLSGCDKGDLFKNPTDVAFLLDINPLGSISSDDLTIEDGYIVLANFSVVAERDQAEDFEFERTFDGGLRIPFGQSTIEPELQFELPQGAYKKITVRFETYGDNGINLQVNGGYAHSDPQKGLFDVQLKFQNPKQFEVEVVDILGSNELMLSEHNAERPKIVFSPKLWFTHITPFMLDNASFVIVDNKQLITIDNNTNITIFNKVSPELGSTVACTLD